MKNDTLIRKGKERDDMISCSFFYRKFESHLSGCADKSQSKKKKSGICIVVRQAETNSEEWSSLPKGKSR